jgi:hypothetical protein
MGTIDLKKQPTILWLLIFAISMGFFESSIVIYLREIYYPEGFDFPLHPIEPQIAVTELIRELFSLIMIISVAILAKRSFHERFANFLFIFAIWDIFYYIFLKLILGWPASPATWDILFLIPLPWTSPVIAPIIISLLMIALALVIYRFHNFNNPVEIKIREWIILIGGAIIIFVSFILDFLRYFLNNFEKYSHHPALEQLHIASGEYHPSSFNWIVYLIGVLTLIAAIFLIYRTNKYKQR